MNNQKPTVEQRLDEILTEMKKLRKEADDNFFTMMVLGVFSAVVLFVTLVLTHPK